jgi:2-polyprenyl-3-methyl-5-hydroxy-6-metoxy-1,4-benzoquinol methylase
MKNKEKLYSKYVSGHARSLYGKASLKNAKSGFVFWRSYFGKFLPENKGAKILDIGCGNGGFIYWLKQLGYENSFGIDISPEQVAEAKEMGISGIELADAKEFLKGKSGFYDAIFARDFLEHFEKGEVLEILDLAKSSLKKEGFLMGQTPNAGNIFWGRLRHGDFTHELSFTKESLNQIFSVAGFEKISVFPQRPVVHGLFSFARLILWIAVEFLIKAYMAVENGSFRGIFTQNLLFIARK